MPEDIVATLRRRAVIRHRGNAYEDFSVGQHFRHHWGRTLTESDNTLFTTMTLHYNPIYFNSAYAKAEGHEKTVVCPLLLFGTVFGLSVEDLSEIGGPFLGVDELTYSRPVVVGETVYAESEVTACRTTKSRPDYGIVTWRTRGFTEQDETLIEFTRSNLTKKRGA